MDELDRFTNPWDSYGLRAWRNPAKSLLIRRLKVISPRKSIPCRRGFFILRHLLGEELDRVGPLELSYAYQRLLIVDWSTRFQALGFFNESEIRAYALLYGPPQDSTLGHFWYGLLGGEDLKDVELICRRRAVPQFLRVSKVPTDLLRDSSQGDDDGS